MSSSSKSGAPEKGTQGGAKLTPMLQQYFRVKEEYPDAILFFRLGDFYEMFFEDAERAAPLLDLTLTSRNKHDETPVPLCGIPYHSAQPYVQKLLAAGHKVAICEQVEDPAAAKGIVDRRVVRVVTPGTILEEENLDPREPNYLVALVREEERWALGVADLSTGELRAVELGSRVELADEIARIRPREIVVAGDAASDGLAAAVRTSSLEPGRFAADAFLVWATSTHGEAVRDAWNDRPLACRALGGLLAYLEDQLVPTTHLRAPETQAPDDFLVLDTDTRRNLEIVESVRGETKGSLLWVIDRTRTPMGARQLRRWLLYPLIDPARIGERLDTVEELAGDAILRDDVRELLKGVGDLERLASRVASRRAGPRDVARLREALARTGEVRDRLGGVRSDALRGALGRLDPLPEVQERIAAALVDEPPATSKNGDVVREGHSAEVDELRSLRRDGKSWISRLESEEREKTGIGSLKVRYNKVFGYYLEVTRANLASVPERYQRKQTLAGAERFITPELKEYEAKVLGAEERLRTLEAELFDRLVEETGRHVASLLASADALGRIDALASRAAVASHARWVRPEITSSGSLDVESGRHPVIERMLPPGRFVANDSALDRDARQILVITGPNMAGKSTYLRQNAVIVILAQTGSFVPATSARIGIVDRIFTRVGASDNLAAGDSTFMVEMKETAHILANLTPRSLVVLDEIGRGTSTFDGISIAWAVAEFLHTSLARPKTLFATHFHELTELAATVDRVVNASVAVREWKGEVVFLHRIVPGPASQSYGIHVARLAGVPAAVIERAQEILRSLEEGERTAAARAPSGQLALFGTRPAASTAPLPDPVIEELAGIDPVTLTPLEALQRLHDLVGKVKDRG